MTMTNRQAKELELAPAGGAVLMDLDEVGVIGRCALRLAWSSDDARLLELEAEQVLREIAQGAAGAAGGSPLARELDAIRTRLGVASEVVREARREHDRAVAARERQTADSSRVTDYGSMVRSLVEAAGSVKAAESRVEAASEVYDELARSERQAEARIKQRLLTEVLRQVVASERELQAEIDNELVELTRLIGQDRLRALARKLLALRQFGVGNRRSELAQAALSMV